MYDLEIPGEGRLSCHEVEHMVLAFALAQAVDLPCPPQQVINWIGQQVGPYTGQPSYWSPYGFVGPAREGAAIYMQPWARGGARYIRQVRPNIPIPDLSRIDPSVWYASLNDRIQHDYGLEGRLAAAFEVASEQTDPNRFDAVSQEWSYVRAAIENRAIIMDPRTINRRREALRRRGFDI